MCSLFLHGYFIVGITNMYSCRSATASKFGHEQFYKTRRSFSSTHVHLFLFSSASSVFYTKFRREGIANSASVGFGPYGSLTPSKELHNIDEKCCFEPYLWRDFNTGKKAWICLKRFLTIKQKVELWWSKPKQQQYRLKI